MTPDEMTVEVSFPADVILCGAYAERKAAQIGFDRRRQQEAAIVARELASNIVKFAKSGTIRLRRLDQPQAGLEVRAEDRGPGIDDIEAALRDRTPDEQDWLDPCTRPAKRGLGTGLGAVQRLTDEMTIETRPGGGTRIVALKYLPT